MVLFGRFFTAAFAAAAVVDQSNNHHPSSTTLLAKSSSIQATTEQQQNNNNSNSNSNNQKHDETLTKLCNLFGASPSNLLSLRTNEQNGIRGVYLNSAVRENDIILKMPLDSCLRDDKPPSWLQQEQQQSSTSTSTDDNNNDENNNTNEDMYYSVSVEGWVTRLAACLLDMQQQQQQQQQGQQSEAIRTWLNLLPTNLREILPIHWGNNDPNLLAQTNSRSLELAIDSAYFARAGPIGDLLVSSNDANLGITQDQIVDALDLVQTRSCRVESSSSSSSSSNNDDDDGTPHHYMRVLVPIFDMINHDRNHNAEFFREGDYMVVRAKRDIDANNEVFINYGDSTRPAWKCLFSYGFVPATEDIYEDDIAEIVVDGTMRIEVGPTEIPFELVQCEAEKLGQFNEGTTTTSSTTTELEFTAEIGQKIVDRIMAAAKELEIIPAENQESNHSLAHTLVKNLRESNRRTLLACAGGLREYIEDMEN